MRKLMLLLCCWITTSSIRAQTLPGLDPSFATNGIYEVVDVFGSFWNLAIQKDDKIVTLGGGKYIARFHPDGAIDSSFGTNGSVTTLIPGIAYQPTNRALLLQPDGKILIGGKADTITYIPGSGRARNVDFFLARLLPNGKPDSSFNSTGYVVTSPWPYKPIGGNSQDEIEALTLQPDGKILALGESNSGIPMVLRYHTDGRLDSSFGTNGIAKITGDFDYPTLTAQGIAILPNGKILFSADIKMLALSPPYGEYVAAIFRLHPDGSTDSSYGINGIAYTNTNLPGLLYPARLLLQADGKTILGFYADSIGVLRFDTSGKLDATFGTNGVAKLEPAGKVRQLYQYPDGKILLGGTLDSVGVIWRLLPDGNKDPSFGHTGRISTKIKAYSNDLRNLGVQSSGKIVACGDGIKDYESRSWLIPFLLRYTQHATSITEYSNPQNALVYPNPARNYLNITSTATLHNTSYTLYNVAGIAIQTGRLKGSPMITIENSTPSGTYFLLLQHASGVVESHKEIIQ